MSNLSTRKSVGVGPKDFQETKHLSPHIPCKLPKSFQSPLDARRPEGGIETKAVAIFIRCGKDLTGCNGDAQLFGLYVQLMAVNILRALHP